MTTENPKEPFSKAAGSNPAQHVISDAEKKRALDPPTDNNLVEELHGVKVSDPFRPLEDIEAPATRQWIDRQNEKFGAYVADTVISQEATPNRYGDKYFVWGMMPNGDRWSLFVRESELPGTPARLLLDPAAIDPSGKTGISGHYHSPDGKRLAYGLSIGGSDETALHILDVETGKNLPDVYPKFRGSVVWDADGEGFHYNRPKEGVNKTFEVLHHKIGASVQDDAVVYSPDVPETRAHFSQLRKGAAGAAGSHDWISVSNTEPGKNALLMRKTGSGDAFTEIFPHKEGMLEPVAEAADGKIYAKTSFGAPRSQLVRFDPASPAPDKWETILPESKQDLLQSAFVLKDKIYATYSHDTGQQIRVFDLEGKHLHDVPLPPLSTFTMNRVNPGDTSFLLTLKSFQEQGNTYRYDTATNKLSPYMEAQNTSDLKDTVVERLYATSKDGTQVPFTVIRGKDTKLDGTAATLLYGYGGFNIALNPEYSYEIANWVRAGGIYVKANLRGGGEFGQEWYDGGRGANKQNVFDDYAAVAEYLNANNYSSPKRLAIQGGSNGGLLTLATALQRPELFGAVVSQVPVTDMNRFHIGSFYGFGWKSDYGDPDIKEDFNNAAKYSPLHNVTQGFKHPPILIQTDAQDNRVLPWHSYKMAATLQAKESPDSLTLLNVNTDGGHGGGGNAKNQRASAAAVRAFLKKTLGPIDQTVYKATLAKKPKNKPAPKAPSA